MCQTQNTKERIFDAACLLFSEHGYDNVATRQISEEARVPHGSIRYHFANKESLYAEVFRRVYGLDNALTYDILLKQEPFALDTPEGKAYAIQRIVFDYFQRHIFIPDPWRRKFIRRELGNHSKIFSRLVEQGLKEESAKMSEFYFLLRPGATKPKPFIGRISPTHRDCITFWPIPLSSKVSRGTLNRPPAMNWIISSS